jgi:hypothetical protein
MVLITIKAREASLKRRLRAHFRELGFQRDASGLLCNGDRTKESYRRAHHVQRAAKLHKDREFLRDANRNFLQFLASGSEVLPERISPRLELIDAGTWQSQLFRFVTHSWSVPVSEGYGRRLRFLVWDGSNGKLIGVIALGDAVFNLGARDQIIGWDQRIRRERLVNVLDAYVLGAVPPYNFLLAGKLIACLVRTREVVEVFRNKYGKSTGIISKKRKRAQLVLATTTSALGRSSVYNRLVLGGERYFEPIGYTSGWGHFHIPDHLFSDMRDYLRLKHDRYASNHRFGEGPNWRFRAVRQTLGLLGMNEGLVQHGFVREIFASYIATNAIPYLRGHARRADYSTLLNVSEVSDLAIERWMHPRAGRRPEYRTWQAEHFSLAFANGLGREVSQRRVDGLRG